MSWLFGVNKQPPYPGGPPQYPPPTDGGDSGSNPTGSGGDGGSDGGKDGKGGKPPVWANFDPTGLERAAQAAKELDKSSKFLVFLGFNIYVLLFPTSKPRKRCENNLKKMWPSILRLYCNAPTAMRR
jgi:hypothetical protein